MSLISQPDKPKSVFASEDPLVTGSQIRPCWKMEDKSRNLVFFACRCSTSFASFFISLKFAFTFHLLIKLLETFEISTISKYTYVNAEGKRCYSRGREYWKYNAGYNVHMRLFDEYICTLQAILCLSDWRWKGSRQEQYLFSIAFSRITPPLWPNTRGCRGKWWIVSRGRSPG